MKRFPVVSLLIALAVLVAACTPAATPAPTVAPTPQPMPTATPEPTPAPKTLVDVAVADGRFTTLVTAVQAAGLVETLSGEGPFTVFAPTDEAFAKLPEGTLDALLKDTEQLKSILLYHVVPREVKAADVVKLTEAETAHGGMVQIKVDGDKVFVNDAQVIITDVMADNGVIHVIDSVLLPPKDIVSIAVEDGRFTTLVAALQAAGLDKDLQGKGPFTVFAPTDDAFAKLPEGTVEALLADIPALKDILLYHVVSGKVMAADAAKLESAEALSGKALSISSDMGNVKINDAKVIITDIQASNGVIHVIDTVLLPPKDIVETAIADGRFTTLVAALQAADLVETLKGEGPFTVFAPTDDAFAKLPAGTVEGLLKDIPTLKNILLYHVVSGKVMAADVVKLTSADTALEKPVTIKVEGDKVFINNAQVIITDIETANGVIHVIDTVLLPPQ